MEAGDRWPCFSNSLLGMELHCLVEAGDRWPCFSNSLLGMELHYAWWRLVIGGLASVTLCLGWSFIMLGDRWPCFSNSLLGMELHYG